MREKRKLEAVVLIGSGGHALVVLDILEAMGLYEVIGVTTNDQEMKGFYGYPVLGTDDDLPRLLKDGVRLAAIGIGGFKDNQLRKKIYGKLKTLGFQIVTAIHPSAVIARDVKIGEGSVVFAGVVLNPRVQIGCNVVVATCSTVDHETRVEDHVLISAGVTVGAYAIVEEEALLAIGCTVVSRKKVGKNALVAAGAVVVKNVVPNTAVIGVPARLWENGPR